ncbi:hypothetical protein BGZ89_005437 [Linnemannia elongata]|nr:hypothetical protein BGZ89_005437 [Linnemannia elongata]
MIFACLLRTRTQYNLCPSTSTKQNNYHNSRLLTLSTLSESSLGSGLSRANSGEDATGCDQITDLPNPTSATDSSRTISTLPTRVDPTGIRHATFANTSVAAAAPYPPTSTQSQLEQR